MLIAHFSDPHVLFLRHACRSLPSGKQLLGLFNWLLRRRRVHRRRRLRDAVEKLLQLRPDVVLVTGDLCQLAYPGDYEGFGRLLRPLTQAGIPVLLLRGNHDRYSRSERTRRAYLALRDGLGLGLWREDGFAEKDGVEFVPLDCAVPTPPFECWGELTAAEVERLRHSALVRGRQAPALARLAFGHFPLLDAGGRPLARKIGLKNAELALALLPELGVLGYFCGHLHLPFTVGLPGGIPQYCSGSLTASGLLRIMRLDKSAEHPHRLQEVATHTFG